MGFILTRENDDAPEPPDIWLDAPYDRMKADVDGQHYCLETGWDRVWSQLENALDLETDAHPKEIEEFRNAVHDAYSDLQGRLLPKLEAESRRIETEHGRTINVF